MLVEAWTREGAAAAASIRAMQTFTSLSLTGAKTMRAVPVTLLSTLLLASLQSCGGGPTSPDRVVSTETLIVDFYSGIDRPTVDLIAAANGLRVIRQRYWPMNPSYKMEIDRTLVPEHVTATIVAEKLVSSYADTVKSARAIVYVRTIHD